MKGKLIIGEKEIEIDVLEEEIKAMQERRRETDKVKLKDIIPAILENRFFYDEFEWKSVCATIRDWIVEGTKEEYIVANLMRIDSDARDRAGKPRKYTDYESLVDEYRAKRISKLRIERERKLGVLGEND